MRIDSHQHVFWHGRDDAGLISDMDEHGIDVAWLLTWNISPEEGEPYYHKLLNPEHIVSALPTTLLANPLCGCFSKCRGGTG